jgi:hypothetical protein
VSNQPYPAIHKIGACWCDERHNLLQAAELNDPEETLTASRSADLGYARHPAEGALIGSNGLRDADLMCAMA